MRGARVGGWLALLTGCATHAGGPRPARTPPALAEVVAPDTPRPELVAPLTALLGEAAGEIVLPLGHDGVRCAFDARPDRARITCEGVTEEAPEVSSIVRKIHTGELTRRLLVHRLDDDELFAQLTGLPARPVVARLTGLLAPPGAASGADHGRDLGGELGVVRFEAGERGQTVQARLAGPDLEEVIEAVSLSELGSRLRERAQQLGPERRARRLGRAEQTGLRWMLGQLSHGPEGWQLGGVQPGRPSGQQPAAEASPLRGTPGERVWPQRWSLSRRVVREPTVETSSTTILWFHALDGVVVRAEMDVYWNRALPLPAELPDCDAYASDVRELLPEARLDPDSEPGLCTWVVRQEPGRVEVSLDLRSITHAYPVHARILWKPEELGALEDRATTLLEKQENARVCGLCSRLRVGRPATPYTTVVSIDYDQCRVSLVNSGVRPGLAQGGGAYRCDQLPEGKLSPRFLDPF